MIRCNNCGNLFEYAEELDILKDTNNAEYLGCAMCQTDMYLEDIEEDEMEGDV